MLCFHCCLVTIQPWEIQPACFTSLPTPRYAYSQILLPLPFSKQTSSHCSPLAAQKTLQKTPGCFADIWQPAPQRHGVFFIGEPTEGWNVLDTGVRGRMGLPPVPRATLGGRVSWDQRPRSSLEHSSGQPRGEQWAAGKDSNSKGPLMLQPVAVSAGKGWDRQDWQPPGCG